MAKLKLIEIVEKLKIENPDTIILIQSGIFFCALGRDAAILNKELNYKPICYKSNICKCGIPINSIEKIIPKLRKTNYSYNIYSYNKDTQATKIIYKISGNKKIKEDRQNIDCNTCWYNCNKRKEESIYIKKLEELMKEENKNENK